TCLLCALGVWVALRFARLQTRNSSNEIEKQEDGKTGRTELVNIFFPPSRLPVQSLSFSNTSTSTRWRWGTLHALFVGLALLLGAAPAFAQDTSPGTGGAGPSRGGKLTKPPQLTNFKEVEAPYPESEKASGRTAAVTLQLAISDQGDVTEVV